MRAITIYILALLGLVLYVLLVLPVSTSSQGYVCPAGSYEIGVKGEGKCKRDPTGCPYGDSVPLADCKAPEQLKTGTWVETTPEPTQEAWGK